MFKFLVIQSLLLLLSFQSIFAADSYRCVSTQSGYSYELYQQYGELYMYDQAGNPMADFDGLNNISDKGGKIKLVDHESQDTYAFLIARKNGQYEGFIFLGEIIERDYVVCKENDSAWLM